MLEVEYRQSFLKDLKNLRGTAAYAKVHELAFVSLPELETSQDIPNLQKIQVSLRLL